MYVDCDLNSDRSSAHIAKVIFARIFFYIFMRSSQKDYSRGVVIVDSTKTDWRRHLRGGHAAEASRAPLSNIVWHTKKNPKSYILGIFFIT